MLFHFFVNRRYKTKADASQSAMMKAIEPAGLLLQRPTNGAAIPPKIKGSSPNKRCLTFRIVQWNSSDIQKWDPPQQA